jgi:hypothetical protein
MANKEKIALISIIILGTFLRFIYLDRIPKGLLPEEVSSSWDAYSVLKTGRDEWGNLLPLIFRESGAYKLPIVSYAMIPSISILGLNELSSRIPTAAASVIALYLTYLIAFQLFKKREVALLASFFLAISPWHISVGRYAMEVNWGLPIFLAGLYFFLKAQENHKWLLLSSFFFGLSFYTYYNYLIFSLLFVIGLIFLYRRIYIKTPKTRERMGDARPTSSRKYLFFFILIQIIFLTPYLFNTNLSVRFKQINYVDNLGLLNRINEHRQACSQVYPTNVCRILYNQPLAQSLEKVRNFINHFSTTTFFLYGSQLNLSGMPERWGFFYLFEFPLLLIGTISLIKNRKFPPIFGLWLLVYAVPGSLAGEGHVWRMFTLLPLPQIIAAVGLIHCKTFIDRNRVGDASQVPSWSDRLTRHDKRVASGRTLWEGSFVVDFRNTLLKIGIVAIICFSFFQFSVDYFAYFPYFQDRYSYFGFRDLYHYIGKIEQNYDYVVVAPTNLGFDQLYIYFLFYSQYDPKSFQESSDIERTISPEYWVYTRRIGKYYFVSDLQKVKFPITPKTLFVTDGSFKEESLHLPKSLTTHLFHTIYYANGNIAFKIMEFRKILP